MVDIISTEKHRLYVPRTYLTSLIMSIGIGYICMGIVLICYTFITMALRDDRLEGFFVILLAIPIMIGAGIFWFSARYRSFILIDKRNNTLKIIRKAKMEEVKLEGVKSITSRTNISIGNNQFILTLNKESGQRELFKERCLRGNNWEKFSKKLSIICGLPFIQERWVENYDGKLEMTTPREAKTMRRRSWWIIIAGTLPLVFAGVYRTFPTQKTFIIFGILAILINNGFIFFVAKQDSSFRSKKNQLSVLLISAFSTTLSTITLYIFFGLLLNSGTLPGIIK